MNPEELELLENAMGALASVRSAAEVIRLRLEQARLETQRPYLIEELRELMAAHEEAKQNLVILRKNGKRMRPSRAPKGVRQLSFFSEVPETPEKGVSNLSWKAR